MQPRSRREILVAFSAIMLATLLAALDQTIVATALPRIATDLGGFDELSWVVTSYLIASTVTIPLYGKLSDLVGRRRVFLVAIGLFVLGSALCGVAGSVRELVAFRVLQGLGAGGLIPLAQAAIGDLFPPRERGRYQGFIGSMWATAAIAGPLLGGVLTDHASWRWIFFLNLPLGAVTIAAVARTMPGAARHRPATLDWSGAVLLAVAIVSGLLACTWSTDAPAGRIAAAAAIAVVATVLFVLVERRAADTLLPFGLLRTGIPRVTAVGAVLVGSLMFALTIYIPVFVQGALGRSATASGTLLIPLLLGWVTASATVGQLVSRTGRYRRYPIAGSLVVVAGSVALLGADTGTRGGTIVVILAVTGAGFGMTWPVFVLAVQNAVPRAQLGAATAALLFFRTVAGSVAVALLGTLLNARLEATLDDRVDTDRLLDGSTRLDAATQGALADALHAVFLAGVPLAVALVLVALALEERPLRD